MAEKRLPVLDGDDLIPNVLMPATVRAAAISATALGVYSPLDSAYGYTSGTNLYASGQAAINAMPSAGGILQLPPGAWTLSQPWTVRSGVQVRGAGDRATTLTATLGVFTWTAAMYQTAFSDMVINAAGGHVWSPTGDQAVSECRISRINVTQQHDNFSIWHQSGTGDYIKVSVTDCFLARPATAAVPGWNLVNSGGACNGSSWTNCIALSNGCTSSPFWRVEATNSNYSHDCRWFDITGEVNAGGLIHLYSARCATIDKVVDYDTGTYTGDVIKVGKSATAGVRSQQVTIRQSGRRGGTLGGGLYDINVVPGGSFGTVVDTPTVSSGAAAVNFTLADQVSLLNAAGVNSSFPSDVSQVHTFGLYSAVRMNIGDQLDLTADGYAYIYNQPVAPATPTGGGVLYVQAGALKYKGSSGTISTIAPA